MMITNRNLNKSVPDLNISIHNKQTYAKKSSVYVCYFIRTGHLTERIFKYGYAILRP